MTDTVHGAAQVVKLTKYHKYELNEEMLKSILMRDDIKELPVVVVSVAGAFRRGKSFLLNFFVRYMTSPPEARADGSWLGKDSKPLTGFSWRGGSKRNTTGILIWSEPFIATLPSGEKVAVLLMDTQGTFDNSSTVRESSTIFALSTLLSSVQIYNVSLNIQEDDLQHLQLFTEYGKLLKDGSGKPFQVLEFLVRDWQFPTEFPFGAAGGAQLLEQQLLDDPTADKELREVRKHIRNCFDKVSCFLMPHPGFEVLKPSFTGNINEISVEFRKYLVQLVSLIFGTENLQPKIINGERVKAQRLYTYFNTYMETFNSGQLPTTTSIMKATAEAGLLTAFLDGVEEYVVNMTRECGEKELCVPPVDLRVLQDRYKSKAETNFNKKKKMGSKEDADKYLQKLSKEIDVRGKEFALINMAKQEEAKNAAEKAYDADIANIGKPFCVHPVDLDSIHSAAVAVALKTFDDARKRITNQPDEERNKFKESLEANFKLLKVNNDNNNLQVIRELCTEYCKYMQNKISVDRPLSTLELKKEHEMGLASVLKSFKKERKRSDSYDQDVFRAKLIQDIIKEYTDFKDANGKQNGKAIMAALVQYKQCINDGWNQRNECLHPHDLYKVHADAVCKALVSFRPSKTCADGFNTADEDEKTLKDKLKARYADLVKDNDAANEVAITSALKVFKDSLEKRQSPDWWWLTGVPIVVSAAKTLVLDHHQGAKADALENFYSKRRNKGEEKTDTYRKKLLKMILESDDWAEAVSDVAEYGLGIKIFEDL